MADAELDFKERARAILCLGELRMMLARKSELRVPFDDESFLIRFVRAKKYDAELAYKAVKNYYKMRAKVPKISSVTFPSFPPVNSILTNFVFGKLKGTDVNGLTVILFTVGKWVPAIHDHNHVIAAYMVLLNEILRDENSQKNGVTFVFDHGGFSMDHVKVMGFRLVLTWLGIFQGSYPLRFKNFLVYNERPIIDLVLVPMKPFMSKKLNQRFKLVGTDYEQIYKIIPQSVLPKSCGGPLELDDAFDTDILKNALENDEYYKGHLGYGYDKIDIEEETQDAQDTFPAQTPS